MCGIAGAIGFNSDMREEMKTYENMQKALIRRGPDQRGIVLTERAALIHTRMTTDGVTGGRQPMKFTAGEHTYTIVCDGMLFNAAELRDELSGDFKFETEADAEIILKSYVKWGADCVHKFNGVFAFAVWDERERRLFLARDRMGAKPLFYWKGHDKFVFASEIGALLEYPEIPRTVDTESAAQIILIAPGRKPGSGMLKDIYEVKYGHCGFYTLDGLNLREYWKLRAYGTDHSFEQTAEYVRSLLEDSIKRQFTPDGNICTLLSGGLDSSLVSSVANREFKKQGKVLSTFSVDYEDNAKYFQKSNFQPDSDPEYIECMKEYLGCEHNWVVLGNDELAGALHNAVDARGLPGMADIDASLLLFCGKIRKHASVALSGECADELFGGYPWYRDKAIRDADGFPWSRSTEYRSGFLTDEYLSRIDPAEYVNSEYRRTVNSAEKLNGDSDENNRMREMMRLNYDWFMQTLVDRNDRMSMHNGLDVRAPFCDYRIAEYMYNVPWAYKDRNGREKGLLREAMRDYLPEKVLNRKKSPYPKTHNPGFLNKVTSMLGDVLQREDSRLLRLVKRSELEKLLRHDEYVQWYGQLMNLPQTIAFFIQLDRWLEKFKVSFEI